MSKAEMIIGTDLTKESALAIEAGLKWAENLGCHGVVMHVHQTDVTATMAAISPEYEEKMEELIESIHFELLKKLELQLKPFVKKNDDVESTVVFGDRARSFIRRASSKNCKMIVFGWNKDLSKDSFWLASTIDRTVRASFVPILVIKNEKALAPQRVLIPFILNQGFIDSFSWIETVGNIFTPNFQFVHYVNSKKGFLSSEMTLENLAEIYPEKAYLLNKFYQFIERCRMHGSQVDISIKDSSQMGVKEAFEQDVSFYDPDLILINTHGLGGLERLYMSSFTEWVIKGLPCSVFVTKTKKAQW